MSEKQCQYRYEGANIVIVPVASTSETTSKNLGKNTNEPLQKECTIQAGEKSDKTQVPMPSCSSQIPVRISSEVNKIPPSSRFEYAAKQYQFIKKETSEPNIRETNTSSQSWASNYMMNIGNLYRRPIKLNLSLNKNDKTKIEDQIEDKNTEKMAPKQAKKARDKTKPDYPSKTTDVSKKNCQVNINRNNIQIGDNHITSTKETNKILEIPSSVSVDQKPNVMTSKPKLAKATLSKYFIPLKKKTKPSKKEDNSKTCSKRNKESNSVEPYNTKSQHKPSSSKTYKEVDNAKHNKERNSTESLNTKLQYKSKIDKIDHLKQQRHKIEESCKEKILDTKTDKIKFSSSSKTDTKHFKKVIHKDNENEDKVVKHRSSNKERKSTSKSKVVNSASSTKTSKDIETQKISESNTSEGERSKPIKSVVHDVREYSKDKNVKASKLNSFADLREKLTTNYSRSLSDYIKQRQNKISRPSKDNDTISKQDRDNLVISVPNKTEDIKSIDVSTSLKRKKSPKAKKAKKIKLIIKVVCEDESSSNSDTEEERKNEDKGECSNADLSFLDDFNIDEIVESLNNSNNSVKLQNDSSNKNYIIETSNDIKKNSIGFFDEDTMDLNDFQDREFFFTNSISTQSYSETDVSTNRNQHIEDLRIEPSSNPIISQKENNNTNKSLEKIPVKIKEEANVDTSDLIHSNNENIQTGTVTEIKTEPMDVDCSENMHVCKTIISKSLEGTNAVLNDTVHIENINIEGFIKDNDASITNVHSAADPILLNIKKELDNNAQALNETGTTALTVVNQIATGQNHLAKEIKSELNCPENVILVQEIRAKTSDSLLNNSDVIEIDDTEEVTPNKNQSNIEIIVIDEDNDNTMEVEEIVMEELDKIDNVLNVHMNEEVNAYTTAIEDNIKINSQIKIEVADSDNMGQDNENIVGCKENNNTNVGIKQEKDQETNDKIEDSFNPEGAENTSNQNDVQKTTSVAAKPVQVSVKNTSVGRGVVDCERNNTATIEQEKIDTIDDNKNEEKENKPNNNSRPKIDENVTNKKETQKATTKMLKPVQVPVKYTTDKVDCEKNENTVEITRGKLDVALVNMEQKPVNKNTDCDTIKNAEEKDIQKPTSVVTKPIQVPITSKGNNGGDTIEKPNIKDRLFSDSEVGTRNTLIENLEERMLKYLKEPIQVLSVIHTGKFSKIFKCKNNNGDHCAVKYLKSCTSARGLAKERMLTKIQKDMLKDKLNVVFMHNSFAFAGSWCFLMDYYPKNLEQALNISEKSFHINVVGILAKQLASALVILRNNNIVHSDINPRHILLNSTNDRLKLCGFENAYYIRDAVVVPNIGMASYRAPEVIIGYSVGYSIDVWAMALVMYQMVTKRKLFTGVFNNDILYKQMCTLGSIPKDMVKFGTYADKHFVGLTFRRRIGQFGQNVSLVSSFGKSGKLSRSLHGAYNYFWGNNIHDKHQKTEEYTKMKELDKLLNDMLCLHPKHRLTIEFIYANRFIYDAPTERNLYQ